MHAFGVLPKRNVMVLVKFIYIFIKIKHFGEENSILKSVNEWRSVP